MGSEQKSPGQRGVDGGNTDSRGRVTGESAEETAGGNHPYQSPHRQLIQSLNTSTVKMAVQAGAVDAQT